MASRASAGHSAQQGSWRFPFCVVPSGHRMFSARHSATRQVLHQSRGWRLPEQVGKARGGGLGVADGEGGHEVSDFRCHPLLTGFRRLFRAGSPRAPRSGAGCGSASGSRRAPRGGRGCWSVSRGPGGGSAGSRDRDVHPLQRHCAGMFGGVLAPLLRGAL